MREIRTRELDSVQLALMGETEKLHIYNGLDCCVTLEVLEQLLPQLDETTSKVYEFERALQAPVLEMRLRGILVDKAQRARVIEQFKAQVEHLKSNLDLIVKEGFGVEPPNWRSPAQLKHFFYTYLKLPPVRKQGSITVDREALEKLLNYFDTQQIVRHLLKLRDIEKKLGTLGAKVDADGRMRTSYNIAGTTTGRLSSAMNDFGAGTNLQNIDPALRSIFIADPGMKLAYIDLEQAESRLVGAIEWNLFHDGRYLDACESGDLHTTVCRLAWTQLPWTGDTRRDREIAEQPFYRQHTYRHMAKVLGHGTNYNGQPRTMASHTKLESKIISEFQSKYFSAFPAHRQWHEHVALQILRTGRLVSLTGRRRHFFGRRDDASTVREAIAFDPQGSVGDILNQGMLQVWRLNKVELLLQVHDAIVVQYPEEQEDELLPQVLEAIQVPVDLAHGRRLIIPSEAKVGWNWSDQSETNPDGLIKYKGADSRRRLSTPGKTEWLNYC